MATIYLTEAELARDLHSVLSKVQEGNEVIISVGSRQVAVLKPQSRSGRPLEDILREARERDLKITFDAAFSNDLEAAISTGQKSWNPPSWD